MCEAGQVAQRRAAQEGSAHWREHASQQKQRIERPPTAREDSSTVPASRPARVPAQQRSTRAGAALVGCAALGGGQAGRRRGGWDIRGGQLASAVQCSVVLCSAVHVGE